MKIIKLGASRNVNQDRGIRNIIVGPVVVNSKIRIRSYKDRNPGIGGSEFHSIQIALLLAEAGASVYLEFEGEVPEISGALPVERLPAGIDLRIATVQTVISGTPSLGSSWIVVSHHPHDGGLQRVKKLLGEDLIAVVNVGRYQFYSNRITKDLNVWLPAFGNFDPALPLSSASRTMRHEQVVGHISSLHKSKGFHIALAGWIKFVESNARTPFTFRVIGSSNLYKKNVPAKSHNLPIAGRYGVKVNEMLKRHSSASRSTSFLGLLTGDVFEEISHWSVALQNPLGIAEADPIVVQDCFMNQVPVIGGALFGMYDYMRYFPELQAHTSGAVARKLGNFIGDKALQDNILLRLKAIQSDLQSRRILTEALWVELAQGSELKRIRGIDPGKLEFQLRWRLTLGGVFEFALSLNNFLRSRVTKFLQSSA